MTSLRQVLGLVLAAATIIQGKAMPNYGTYGMPGCVGFGGSEGVEQSSEYDTVYCDSLDEFQSIDANKLDESQNIYDSQYVDSGCASGSDVSSESKKDSKSVTRSMSKGVGSGNAFSEHGFFANDQLCQNDVMGRSGSCCQEEQLNGYNGHCGNTGGVGSYGIERGLGGYGGYGGMGFYGAGGNMGGCGSGCGSGCGVGSYGTYEGGCNEQMLYDSELYNTGSSVNNFGIDSNKFCYNNLDITEVENICSEEDSYSTSCFDEEHHKEGRCSGEEYSINSDGLNERSGLTTDEQCREQAVDNFERGDNRRFC